MIFERSLEVIKMGKKERYFYYVDENMESEFDCKMYCVGIRGEGKKEEIEDFSPCKEEAVKLCELLYENCVMPKRIYAFSEEFIVMGNI